LKVLLYLLFLTKQQSRRKVVEGSIFKYLQ